MKAILALLPAIFLFSNPIFQAAETGKVPEYLASFDPKIGFKPAQRDLTEIFLQLAGSLEATGGPESYIRHVLSEHRRIEELSRQKFSKEPRSYRPLDMPDAYVDRLIGNWKLLSPKLGLEDYAKEFGNLMRDAVKGTRGTGTILIEIFNEHQKQVLARMSGDSAKQADFKALQTELISRLELNNKNVNEGGYEVSRRDAVSFAIVIRDTTTKLFKRVDERLNPEDAARVKAVLTSIILDVGKMAQSELEAGIAEWALEKSSGSPK